MLADRDLKEPRLRPPRVSVCHPFSFTLTIVLLTTSVAFASPDRVGHSALVIDLHLLQRIPGQHRVYRPGAGGMQPPVQALVLLGTAISGCCCS
jgi:hypothetical protein